MVTITKAIRYIIYRYILKHISFLRKIMTSSYRKSILKYREKIKTGLEECNYTLIEYDTYDRYLQLAHPDILLLDQSDDVRYLLFATPYPYCDVKYENPTLYSSIDGIEWISISENMRPVDIPKDPSSSYLSDPDIIKVEGKFYLYYREFNEKSDGFEVKIYKYSTGDYRIWNLENKKCIFTSKDNFVSPSSVYLENNTFVFFIKESTKNVLVRFVDRDDSLMEYHEALILGIPDSAKPWHIDVVFCNDYLIGVISVKNSDDSVGNKLYLVRSKDKGCTWKVKHVIDFHEKCFSAIDLVYRSCILIENNDINLYITVRLKDYTWTIIRTKTDINMFLD